VPAIKRILIIGASGFIGRRLTKKLAEAGHGVVVAKRRGSVTSEVAGENLKIVILPDDTYDGLPGAISGTAIDMIVNCAAYGVHPHDRDPNQMYIVNVALPVALVELAARKQAGLIHLGSSAEYAAGGLESPVSEDATVEAYKFYGGSKYCGGALMNLKARAIDVPSAVLRLFNVFGPGEGDHRLLPTLTGKLHRRERAALSAGNQIRDFIYVDDVVAAIVAAMNALHDGLLSGGEFFNVSTGIGTPVRQFVMLAASAMKADPGLLGFGDVPVRPDEVPLLVGNNQRFAAATGWEPKFSLSAGIQAAISEAEMDKA
jgi:nucleoside-diphosphate-sugar epimerase